MDERSFEMVDTASTKSEAEWKVGVLADDFHASADPAWLGYVVEWGYDPSPQDIADLQKFIHNRY